MGRATIESPEEQPEIPVFRTLDARLADLLAAIEQEQVPARLLRLAQELQSELVRRKQRLDPN